MKQQKAVEINFDPEFIMMDPHFIDPDVLRNWTTHSILDEEGCPWIIFNVEQGFAYERLDNGSYGQLVVTDRWYDAPRGKAADAYHDEEGYLFERECGQQGWIELIRPHWSNGKIVPQPAERIVRYSILLQGDSYTLRKFKVAADGSRKQIYNGFHNKRLFSDTIQIVPLPDANLPIVKPKLVRTWRHSEVGTIRIYEQMLPNGKTANWGELSGGHKLYGSSAKTYELTCSKGRLNSVTGEWISTRGLYNPKRYPRQCRQMHRV